jgi:lipoate-protein ligase A
MKDIWRLLSNSPAQGVWNMAVDEAVFIAVGRGESPPTLRLYSWEPPCLSLGYAQPLTDVDIPRLHVHGWELVRRPTGGRAILHTDEITYSVSAPLDDPRVAGTLLESYGCLATALVEALHLLKLEVEIQDHVAGNSNTHNPVCFEVPSSSEITVGGKKLIGSAQARRKEGILQHGSLPLTGDLTRILQVLVFPDEDARTRAASNLLKRAATVEAVLGRVVSWNEAAQAFATAFRTVFALDLQPGDLSQQEKDIAGQLAANKYYSPDWNRKQKS